jgi:ComF family protein
MFALNSSLQNLVHLFFPHVCNGCGTDVLDDKHMLCLRCLSELPETNFFGQPGNPVEKNFYGRMGVQNAGAAYFFTKDSLIETLIYELKYRGNKDIGNYMGKLMAKYLENNERFASIDVLIPLPLNPRRQRKRGYNQATALCNGIATVWRKPILENAVVRKVHTETQTQRGRVNRWQNMQGVFAVVDPASLQNKHILLVDDVVTTGASLEACGSELLKIPGTRLSIATLAYTI